MPVLQVQNLTVGIRRKGALFYALREVSFEAEAGEIIGIAGESGSGKTMAALSLLGLLPEKAQILEGSIRFLGQELTSIKESAYRKLRGREISMVFQEPMTSLNPVLTIGTQLQEMLRIHAVKDMVDTELSQDAYIFNELRKAGLPEPEKICRQYPHQLSGGMRQRVMIVMAVLLRPKILIADEPTTALDALLQNTILELIKKLCKEHKITVLLISHDLTIIQKYCSRALILQQGRMIEQGNIKELFSNPQAAYTKQLIQSSAYTVRLQRDCRIGQESLLQIQNLTVYFSEKKTGSAGKSQKRAVDDVSFALLQDEILGIVGESGSGKTTLAKTAAGLIPRYQGTITSHIPEGKRLQMVFQDPYGSLNPSRKIGWILQEPLKLHLTLNREQRMERVYEMLSKVGLERVHADRFPSELSGGQRQRAAIAFALMQKPEAVILDEPVSALDGTIQKQIIELLLELKQEYHLSYLFITHDMKLVSKICDRALVMHNGRVIESNTVSELFQNPQEAYTKRLIAEGM